MDIQAYELTETEIEFLSQKEDEGNLVSEISNEFSNNADQITITPPNDKKFKLVGIKLYPVVNTISLPLFNEVRARRADVELTFDGVIRDVVTYDAQGAASNASDPGVGGSSTGQLTGLAKGISMVGDGAKAIKLTSTNTSGTYRVSILGYYEDA